MNDIAGVCLRIRCLRVLRIHGEFENINASTTFSSNCFCLSILWRASVSSIPVFKHVALGPHEDKIRSMLLKDDAGDPLTYPVQVFALHFEGDHFRDFLVEPTHMRVEGRKGYRFVFMGFVIFVYVSSQPITPGQQKLAIDPSRPIQTFDTELGDLKFLRSVWNRAIGSSQNQ